MKREQTGAPAAVGSGVVAPMTPAILYAAKSTDDPRGSIPTQLGDARTLAKREGLEVVAEHTDEARSAYHGSRGPGLAAAKELAERLAREHGGCALIVQHSDRLARGDGRESAHLIEHYLWALKANVRLRSVQDDSNLEDMIRAVLVGERNHEDSKRKSAAVKAGKIRQLERGERQGGPVPDGYTLMKEVDGSQVRSTYALDSERAPILARIFELAAANTPDAVIARQLNAEGLRTRGGKPWYRRRVQDTVTNPWYAGRVTRGRTIAGAAVEVAPGSHPVLVDAETFDRIQGMRARRDLGAGSDRSPKGRPTTNHMLAGLGVCGRCGERMSSITGTYRRKRDGGRARTYMCANVRHATGLCDAPSINAEVVDAHVAEHLERLFVDFDAWAASLTARRDDAAGHLAALIESEAGRLRELDRKISKLTRAFEDAVDAGDTAIVAAAADARAVRTGERDQAEHRLAELRETLAAAEEQPEPIDAMLDWFNDLAAEIRGTLGASRLQDANARLRERFECFVLDTLGGRPRRIPLPPDVAQPPGAVLVFPLMRPEQGPMPNLAVGEILAGIAPPIKGLSVPVRSLSESRSAPGNRGISGSS
jgi:DNA invertase Pin-like site-specific DNA recombinase